MTTTALHPSTKTKLTSALSALPHALLLSGEAGTGLGTIAKQIAGKELLTLIEPIDSKEHINHESGTITVAKIRELYEQTRSKSTTRRIVIIDDADRMSLGAQAAFLKLLEEPHERIHFILTTHFPRRLLPTIRSRLQTITVEPLSAAQTNEFLDSLGVSDQKTRVQLQYLAAGLPAELIRLTTDDTYFKRRAEVMSSTRTFLTGTPYQKLLVIHAYQQDKTSALQLIDSALVVTKHSLRAKPQHNLIKQLSALLRAREKIEANCNIRLQLTTLAL